jgi:uroporphyrin-III C-methyltransferase/precorrin-2 dehydrogenase/sirohydrochlorin ferrochelatase
MIRAARKGKRVVRLKGGDPFVFGRGAEEAMALAAAGVPFDVVPGVTSAIAAPALAGIPVTHRGTASAFLVVSGHTTESLEILDTIAPNSLSLIVLMGIGSRAALAARLTGAGWNPGTPSAIVCGASTPDEWTWTGPLGSVGPAMPPAGIAGVLVIGEVVRIREALSVVATVGVGSEEVRYGRSR